MRIAIQPDLIIHSNGERQSYSERWTELAAAEGIEATAVDVYANDAIARIAECDGFMWRSSSAAQPRRLAKRLLPAIEQGMGIPVYPSWKTLWHYEDKIAQTYLLSAAGIDVPETSVFWDRQQALSYAAEARYPFVVKLSDGIQANNVRLVRNAEEAADYIDRLFGRGVLSLEGTPDPHARSFRHRCRVAADILLGQASEEPRTGRDLHHGYFYAQEFLAGNAFDTRITVIGNRAFGFRRFNRPNDFRASGSGRIDWDPAAIAEDFVRLAFRAARTLQTEVVAIDGLRRGNSPVIGELTLAFASWAVRNCPGHWSLEGAAETGTLNWVEGALRPEDAIFADFLAKVRCAGP